MTARLPDPGQDPYFDDLTDFLKVAHNGDGTLKSGLTIPDGGTPVQTLGSSGQNQNPEAQSVTTATRLAAFIGSDAAPDTGIVPAVRIVRTMSAPSGVIGDGAEQLSVLQGIAYGDAAMTQQTVAVYGAAVNKGTSGVPDTVALYGYARIMGSGTGAALGLFVQGRKDGTAGKVASAEIQSANYSGVDDSYNSVGFQTSQALWVNANGTARSSAGLVFGNPFNRQFDVGIGFVSLNGGPARLASIRDDGNAVTVYDINGSHTDVFDTTGATISGKLFKITVPGTYVVTNPTTDRTLDVTGNTLAQGLAVLGTLIADLQAEGLIG